MLETAKKKDTHILTTLPTNTMADVPLLVISEYASSERRITPSWTIFQLKTKLEPVTGIPPSCQRLSLKQSSGAEKIPIEAADDDAVHLSSFPLAPYAELHVSQPFSISLAAERFHWPGMRRLTSCRAGQRNLSLGFALISLSLFSCSSASASCPFLYSLRVRGGRGRGKVALQSTRRLKEHGGEIPKRASHGGLWAAKRLLL